MIIKLTESDIIRIVNKVREQFIPTTNKVKWRTEVVKKGNLQYDIKISASIDKGWHLYSQTQYKDAIALPTKITYSKNPTLIFIGKTKENGNIFDQIDKTTGKRARFYKDSVVFTQSIKLRKNIRTSLNCEINYMVCNESQCLPPTKEKILIRLN